MIALLVKRYEQLIKQAKEVEATKRLEEQLDTSLREQVDASLAKMNDDLAKAGAYNEFRKKQITAQTAMRNAAAHGEDLTFTTPNVGSMIADVERFLTDSL